MQDARGIQFSPETVAAFRRCASIYTWAGLFVPWVFILLAHAEWLLAWRELGQRPIAWQHDPTSIRSLDPLHIFTGLTLVASIAALPLVLPLAFFSKESVAKGAIWMLVVGLAWVLALLYIFWDPLVVMEWWMD
ncbi:MAG: hypothetical protein AAGA57_13010 [Planctomycetota bacterium]